MNTMLELPPILSGSAEEQLRQLRDYLVRLAREPREESAAASAVSPAPYRPAARSGTAAAPQSAEEARRQAAALRALIVKTAERQDAGERALGVVEQSVGELRHTMRTDYVAQSEFGTYTQRVTAEIEAAARAVTESYRYAELVSAAAAAGVSGDLKEYMTLIDGQIRRGYLTDPDTGETEMGIAISQKLSFTGTERSDFGDGETYYEIDGEQTLGLYTSTGWQFWVGGRKIGWFDSADGMLHVARLVAEQELRLGAGWLMTTTGGFGLRYTGG